MNLDDALQTFIAECCDLLQNMEEVLLRIAQTPDDVDTINAIFRAAHTIKGSAGLFTAYVSQGKMMESVTVDEKKKDSQEARPLQPWESAMAMNNEAAVTLKNGPSQGHQNMDDRKRRWEASFGQGQ